MFFLAMLVPWHLQPVFDIVLIEYLRGESLSCLQCTMKETPVSSERERPRNRILFKSRPPMNCLWTVISDDNMILTTEPIPWRWSDTRELGRFLFILENAFFFPWPLKNSPKQGMVCKYQQMRLLDSRILRNRRCLLEWHCGNVKADPSCLQVWPSLAYWLILWSVCVFRRHLLGWTGW